MPRARGGGGTATPLSCVPAQVARPAALRVCGLSRHAERQPLDPAPAPTTLPRPATLAPAARGAGSTAAQIALRAWDRGRVGRRARAAAPTRRPPAAAAARRAPAGARADRPTSRAAARAPRAARRTSTAAAEGDRRPSRPEAPMRPRRSRRRLGRPRACTFSFVAAPRKLDLPAAKPSDGADRPQPGSSSKGVQPNPRSGRRGRCARRHPAVRRRDRAAVPWVRPRPAGRCPPVASHMRRGLTQGVVVAPWGDSGIRPPLSLGYSSSFRQFAAPVDGTSSVRLSRAAGGDGRSGVRHPWRGARWRRCRARRTRRAGERPP